MILITGGAGFIGSHLADKLIDSGHDVVCVDNLDKQVHPEQPGYLNKKSRYLFCDASDTRKYAEYLLKADTVFHFAARVGVGQSQYELESYVNANIHTTAKLLQFFIDKKAFPRKLIVAGSMSSYGEGPYSCNKCGVVRPPLRTRADKRNWDPLCPACKGKLSPMPTPEDAPFQSNSIYALTKQVQEQMVLNWGAAYKVPAVSLRFFNVYGPRQTLNNPYTGVSAIFMNRILNNKPPTVFEDGLQSRSFVSVFDIVQACLLGMESPEADFKAFNVGTDRITTILDIARMAIAISGKSLNPVVTGEFRSGDIRHCTSDISRIGGMLGYKPKVRLEEGLAELYKSYSTQKITDNFDSAYRELKEKNLLS